MSASQPSASSASAPSDLQQRLSEQLQALSQVGELLTLRLLELEMRVASFEEQLLDVQLERETAPSAGSHALLSATEERIARLEDLLQGNGGPARAKRADVMELNPFPEEEEQPFMDELLA